jgi:hypothetical protein
MTSLVSLYRTAFPKPFVVKTEQNPPLNKMPHNPDAQSLARLCIYHRLLQMRDCLVERIDHPIIHNVAIFVGPCEKLTPDWKEDVP